MASGKDVLHDASRQAFTAWRILFWQRFKWPGTDETRLRRAKEELKNAAWNIDGVLGEPDGRPSFGP